MKKKFLLSILFTSLFALAVIGMSAFEAQVINVTATIENSLSVDTNHIDYGTVYPQEERDEIFSLELSQSFIEQDRVDTVDYIIRQKPKCWSESLQEYGVVSEDTDGNFFCKDEGDFVMLPLLCPYLSKHEITEDGDVENDSDGINAFHGPISGWTLSDTLATEVAGQLINGVDILDEWNIDLRVPCFEGSCAQDWEDFVFANNPDAIAADYILPTDQSSQKMGCDLWVEVNGIDNTGQGGPDCVPTPEVCDDQVDNDCDDDIDCADADCAADPACAITPLCQDDDSDGYGVGADRSSCTFAELDCDDSDDLINPEENEICDDGKDNDCNTDVDCQDSACGSHPACIVSPSCTDNDGDTFNIEGSTCGLEDCNDDNGDIYPGAVEACNALDDDCDGTVDEAWPELGNSCSAGMGICEAQGSYICDSQNIFGNAICDAVPGTPETEICNALDDDCDGTIDEAWPELGNACSVGEGECEVAGTYICNSGNPGSISVCSATPGTGSAEVCNDTLDNDCDGVSDCEDSDCTQDPACTAPPSYSAGDVLINEVAWMGTDTSTADEWIELYNTTGASINLNNWTLNATDGTPAITLTGTVAANAYYLLERTDDTSVPGVSADQIYSGILGNTSDDLVLRTPGSLIIDSADGSTGWPAGDNTSKRTMERCPDLSWHTSAAVEGSPRVINSACTATINFADIGASPQYGYVHDYSGASASFTYAPVTDSTVAGTITGTGLKPYATYQLKFNGTPTCQDAGGDDAINETIGYLGRWWDETDGDNATDTDYESGDGHCYSGYLVWGHVTADASGNFSKAVETGASYHVFWCDTAQSCGGSNSNLSLGTPDAAHPAVQFCDAANVYGEFERACSGQSFAPGDYDLKMILNEESFHQGPGTWTAVMEAGVDFVIY